MENRSLGLAYFQLNSDFAKALIADLQHLGVQFSHTICDKLTHGDLWEKVASSKYPTIVLLSDNFLKSAASIAESTRHVSDLAHLGKLKFIIVPGRYRDEINLEYFHVPTRFRSASELLKYASYWNQVQERESTRAAEIPFHENQNIEVSADYATIILKLLHSLRKADYTFKAEELANTEYKSLLKSLSILPVKTDTTALRNVLEGKEIEPSRPKKQSSLALEKKGKEKPELVRKALKFEQAGNYKKAKKTYEKMIQSDAGNAFPYFRLALLHWKHLDKNSAKSRHFLKTAIRLDKKNAEYHFIMGQILYHQLAKFGKARKHFERAIELNENYTDAYNELGNLLNESGDSDAAERLEQKAKLLNSISTPADVGNAEADEPTGSEDLEESGTPAHEFDFTRFKMPDLSKKTVLVTGATSGIGKATAKKFSKKGYNVIMTGRRADRLESQLKSWEKTYGNCIGYLVFDVRDFGAVKKALDSLTIEWSRIDILVNNAGLARGFDPIHTGDISDWNEMIDTNVKGLLHMTRLISPMMVERNSGHIINLGSIAGREVYPNGNVYCASKFAVEALTRAIRIDLYKYNIRVSEVSPAHVEDTEFAKVRFHWDEEKAKIYQEFNPLTSSDIANAIYFIAKQPERVNIQDILLMGTQQPNALFIDKSGRKFDKPAS